MLIKDKTCRENGEVVKTDGLIISDTGGYWPIDSHPFGNTIQRYCKSFLFNMLNYNNFG